MNQSIGLLHTGLRGDEKLLLKSASARGVELVPINVSTVSLGQDEGQWEKHDIYLERCLSTVKGLHIVDYLTRLGHRVVNPISIAHICNSKFATSSLMHIHKVPAPRANLVFTEEQAKEAVEELGGFPVVVKSDSGSWGRLISIVSDYHSLESIIEHKHVLGSVQHTAVYMQEYIQKPGRDIRCFVIAGQVVAAICRSSEHWITNTARGAVATNHPVTDKLADICRSASDAVASETGTDGGVLAIDLLEDKEKGPLVNEINHTMEFKNSETPTGVSISGAILDYCISHGKKA